MADKTESEIGNSVDLCNQVNEIKIDSCTSTSDQDEAKKPHSVADLQAECRKKETKHHKGIKKKDVALPKCFKGKLAFVLKNVFSKEECDEYIRKTEDMGYEEALLNVGAGRQVLRKDVRNNTRCIWDSFEEAGRIWGRIKSFIPEVWNDRQVMGLNERLRFLKYDPGEYFAPHMDGCYQRENGERSYITIQLYLNEGFKGGSTTFMNFNEEEKVEVVPKTGMILVFQHDIMHEGSELRKGRKYTVRTDVMYDSVTITRPKP